MCAYTRFTSAPPILYRKYHETFWFDDVANYLQIRYYSIEGRIINCFRYVDLHEENKNVFSYEFASILRDVGSAFSSVLDTFVSEINSKEKRYNITDYLSYLNSEIKGIEDVGVELNFPLQKRMIFPYVDLSDHRNKLIWWDSYNIVKHIDIKNYKEGNLSNVLYGVASIAIIYKLMSPAGHPGSSLFINIGYFDPPNLLTSSIYPY